MDSNTLLWIVIGLGVLVAAYFIVTNPFKTVVPLPVGNTIVENYGGGWGGWNRPLYPNRAYPYYGQRRWGGGGCRGGRCGW